VLLFLIAGIITIHVLTRGVGATPAPWTPIVRGSVGFVLAVFVLLLYVQRLETAVSVDKVVEASRLRREYPDRRIAGPRAAPLYALMAAHSGFIALLVASPATGSWRELGATGGAALAVVAAAAYGSYLWPAYRPQGAGWVPVGSRRRALAAALVCLAFGVAGVRSQFLGEVWASLLVAIVASVAPLSTSLVDPWLRRHRRLRELGARGSAA
jgi:hypothetical protein